MEMSSNGNSGGRDPFGRSGNLFRKVTGSQGFNLLVFFIALYFFIIGIKLMGSGFKGLDTVFGSEEGSFAETLVSAVSNPLVGLCMGVFITAVVQSSSATTSTVVAMVAVNPSFFPYAIPIVIGANIGTSVTNIIVSLGHIRHPPSFRRAFAGALVHDFFNVTAASLIFPAEWLVRILTGKGFLERLGVWAASGLVGSRGVQFDLIHRLLDPVLDPIKGIISGIGGGIHPHAATFILIGFGLVVLFVSLTFITKSARRAIDGKVQRVVDRVLFRNAPTSFLFGLTLTSFVQSSSVTTSIAVPLVGGGILTIEQIFPYTLGANVGTTVTALLAALAADFVGEGGKLALAISFVHLFFNIMGIALIYPLRKVPIYLARRVARYMAANRKMAIVFLFVVFFLTPGIVIIVDWYIL
ncbi:MAG TPA: sodium dependent phosphate transporter [Euryarchaeota archaeon]|nr:sodium dependent phosphate transporter [Euryarchaeota archaeon]